MLGRGRFVRLAKSCYIPCELSGPRPGGGFGLTKRIRSKLADLYPFPCLLPCSWIAKEFSTSNFFAVTADNRFVTPDSPTVLPSITNKSLMQLAADQGMKVERRPVLMTELGSFSEVAACGTAVVITPIKQIVYGGEVGLSS